jgi:hypothetical protein
MGSTDVVFQKVGIIQRWPRFYLERMEELQHPEMEKKSRWIRRMLGFRSE